MIKLYKVCPLNLSWLGVANVCFLCFLVVTSNTSFFGSSLECTTWIYLWLCVMSWTHLVSLHVWQGWFYLDLFYLIQSGRTWLLRNNIVCRLKVALLPTRVCFYLTHFIIVFIKYLISHISEILEHTNKGHFKNRFHRQFLCLSSHTHNGTMFLVTPLLLYRF